MTQTLEPVVSTDRTPQQRIDAWLEEFEAALSALDVGRATNAFLTDSYWRDLTAFTWNIKTVEGHEQISDMLTARLADTRPAGFATTEDATDDGDGVASAFISFETAVGRCEGHVRIRPDSDGTDRAWTLLTTMQELKDHEERRGPTRVLGAVHGSDPDTRSWAEKKADEELELGRTVQPYVLVIGGGQGGIALGARLRQLGGAVDRRGPS